MSIMMLMVCNQMPSTSNYVPLMSWYYMGIIFVIVFGTVLATIVLFIHGRKVHIIPLPTPIRKILLHKAVWVTLVEPPVTLIESWTEYGILSESRIDANSLDPLLLERMRSNKGC
ncbi:ACR-5-like protein [Aphelenchoides avenae]|nr:ACR-5-like protein [Aphelenchus avenae]